MKPAPFKYIEARSLHEALALKAEGGEEAKFLAGGQSLVPAMNFRLAEPAVLIDINSLTELAFIRHDADKLAIGALTRHRTLERDPLLASKQPLLGEALGHIAHPPIRNRGTFGGNLAHADPASELPAVVLAIGGRLRTRSTAGERWIAASDFFVGVFSTTLRPDEMLVEIELPNLPPRSGVAFLEVARRPGDFALLGVAAIITLGQNGACSDARLTYCGASDRPIRATEATSLVGRPVGDAEIRQTAALIQQEIDPPGNLHASAGYQRHLAGVLTRRALTVALERARRADEQTAANG